jgi:heptosyltransferase II
MKILIEIPSWLGDSVMATPAIENLLNFHQESEFIIVGSEISVQIFKNHPKISRTYILNKNYLSLFLLTQKIGKFDLFFSFRESVRSSLFKIFIKSSLKFGYKKANVNKSHQVEKYVEFINKSLNSEFPEGLLTIHQEITLQEYSKAIKGKKPILGLNPGASYGSSKRWYPEEFAELAASLSSKYDITILGGPNEQGIAMDIEKLLVKKGVKNYQNLAGSLNISELIEHISNFEIFVTGDSGPMHIAATYQIPTVSIFGPTKDKETSQWKNEKSIVVKSRLDCQPCMKRTCPLNHHNCMKLIKAEDILIKINLLNL